MDSDQRVFCCKATNLTNCSQRVKLLDTGTRNQGRVHRKQMTAEVHRPRIFDVVVAVVVINGGTGKIHSRKVECSVFGCDQSREARSHLAPSALIFQNPGLPRILLLHNKAGFPNFSFDDDSSEFPAVGDKTLSLFS